MRIWLKANDIDDFEILFVTLLGSSLGDLHFHFEGHWDPATSASLAV